LDNNASELEYSRYCHNEAVVRSAQADTLKIIFQDFSVICAFPPMAGQDDTRPNNDAYCSTFGYFSFRIPIENAPKKPIPIFPVAKVDPRTNSGDSSYAEPETAGSKSIETAPSRSRATLEIERP
jgi:hypothetical protein